jgi:hypothetical protein
MDILWHCRFMEAQPAEPTPFQKFAALTRQVMSVPKSEIDRRAAEDKKRRKEQKRIKGR